MKKMMSNVFGMLLGSLLIVSSAYAVDFGDFSSAFLTSRAWGQLNQGKPQEAIEYTNKCIEMYAAQAREMQSRLSEYPQGEKDEIHKKYWALNDVATCYFIKGKALAAQGKTAEAKEAFDTLIKEYTFGQCWDNQGWFWKVAEGAEKEMALL